MVGPAFFVGSCGTAGWLEERGQFVGVDLQQSRADANCINAAVGNPAAHRAVGNIAVVGGLLQTDQFGVPTFASVEGCARCVVGHRKDTFCLSELPSPRDCGESIPGRDLQRFTVAHDLAAAVPAWRGVSPNLDCPVSSRTCDSSPGCLASPRPRLP